MLLVRANHADNTPAAHNLALIANFLDGRSDLHSRFSLLIPTRPKLLDNPAPARIVRHQRHSHPVADDHADVVASHGTRQVRRHLMPPVEFDPNQVAREQLEDNALSRPIRQACGSSPFAPLVLTSGYAEAPQTPHPASSTRGTRLRSPPPCARSAPTGALSFVTAVHPSPSTFTAGLPAFTIGSIARTMPSASRGPRPAVP